MTGSPRVPGASEEGPGQISPMSPPFPAPASDAEIKKKSKHDLLDLGEREVFGDWDKLEGTPHQVSVALGHEFDPSDWSIGFHLLSGRDERDEPVPGEEPARVESPKTTVLR